MFGNQSGHFLTRQVINRHFHFIRPLDLIIDRCCGIKGIGIILLQLIIVDPLRILFINRRKFFFNVAEIIYFPII